MTPQTRALPILFLFAACASAAVPSATGRTVPPVPPSFRVRVVGSGPPMILIPGLACSGSVWDGTVDHFKNHFQMHILTLAGFAGEQAIPGPFLDTVRRDLIRYIKDRKLDHPVIVGHSLGGFLAYWIAATAADATGPIVAVDGVPFLADLFEPGATVETSRPKAEAMRQGMRSLQREQFIQQNRFFLASMITAPKDVERVAKDSSKSDPSSVGDAMYELLTTDLRARVGSIRVPTLLVAGGAGAPTEDARKAIVAQCERQLARIPNHRIALAEKARHFVMLDAPEFLFAQMDAFLRAPGVN